MGNVIQNGYKRACVLLVLFLLLGTGGTQAAGQTLFALMYVSLPGTEQRRNNRCAEVTMRRRTYVPRLMEQYG